MRTIKKCVIIALAMILFLSVFSGCSKKEEPFTFSTGLAQNGRWEGVNALEHVTLCDYKAIHIPADVHRISDAQIDASVDELLASHQTAKNVTNRPVRDGDTVNIDYVGSVDGVEFEGGSTGGNGTDVTIGVTSYIDDFLEQLIGHKPGETFDIHVTFPEDYGTEESGNAHLNGKDAVFVTTVNHIVEHVAPTLNDAFVQETFFESNGWSTVRDMRNEIRSNLEDGAISGFLQDYILTNSTVLDVPDAMLSYQENLMIKQYEDYAAYYNMSLEEFLPNIAGVETVDELLASHKDENTQSAKFYLIVQAIAEEANIEVKDANLRAYFEKYAGSADYTQYKDYYGKPYLVMMVQTQNVLDFLRENAVLEQE